MTSLPRGKSWYIWTSFTRIRMISKSNAKKAVSVQFLPKRGKKEKKKGLRGILFRFRSVIVSRAIFDARAQLRAYSHKVCHLWNNGPVGRKTYLCENRKSPCCGVGVGEGGRWGVGWVTLAEALSWLGHWRFPAASGRNAARFNSFNGHVLFSCLAK